MTNQTSEEAMIFPKNSHLAPTGTFIEPKQFFSSSVGGKRKKSSKNCKNCKHRFVSTGKHKKSVKCIKCEYRKMARKMTRKNYK